MTLLYVPVDFVIHISCHIFFWACHALEVGPLYFLNDSYCDVNLDLEERVRYLLPIVRQAELNEESVRVRLGQKGCG